jgi:hypothetical protein
VFTEITEVVDNHTSIMGCDLLLTCYACPEQYDVFLEGTQIGYLRLRHGSFAVSVLYRLGVDTLVYQAYTKGDGMFYEEEREHYLIHAVEALIHYKNSLDLVTQS